MKSADLLIGAVLVAGAKAPKTVSEAMVMSMKKGSVIVDVAIDQGGSIATVDRATTHDNPSYDKVRRAPLFRGQHAGRGAKDLHLRACGRHAALPAALANKGVKRALLENKALLVGLNTYGGKITCKNVAESQGLEYADARECAEKL